MSIEGGVQWGRVDGGWVRMGLGEVGWPRIGVMWIGMEKIGKKERKQESERNKKGRIKQRKEKQDIK